MEINAGNIRLAQEQDLEAILKCNATSSTQSTERLAQISIGVGTGRCLVWENEGLNIVVEKSAENKKTK